MAQIKLRDPFNDPAATIEPAERRPGDTEARVQEPTIRLSVDLERSLHRRLRRWALDGDRTAAEVVRELLTSALDTAGY
jgi:hypothetical protein